MICSLEGAFVLARALRSTEPVEVAAGASAAVRGPARRGARAPAPSGARLAFRR